MPENEYAGLARRLCDRHYGPGGDGLLIVEKPTVPEAAFRMRIFNTDGSEAEMCGNGIRCFARYLHDYGWTDQVKFTVETGAGLLIPELKLADGQVTGVCVDMGEPILKAEDIPVRGIGKDRVVAQELEVAGRSYQVTCVSMGNPHCVVFVDDAEAFPIEEAGPHFEKHEAFPRRVNAEFVTVRDRRHLRMRVWERGASVTLACGTGSCATLVAAVLTGRAERQAEIELDGGKLQVEWSQNNHVFMTGPAELVYAGRLPD